MPNQRQEGALLIAAGVLMVYGCWSAGGDGYELPVKLLAVGPAVVIVGLVISVVPTHWLYRIDSNAGGFCSWAYIKNEKTWVYWATIFMAMAVGIGHWRYFETHGYVVSR